MFACRIRGEWGGIERKGATGGEKERREGKGERMGELRRHFALYLSSNLKIFATFLERGREEA